MRHLYSETSSDYISAMKVEPTNLIPAFGRLTLCQTHVQMTFVPTKKFDRAAAMNEIMVKAQQAQLGPYHPSMVGVKPGSSVT